MLTQEARQAAKQYNMRAKQILWRGILPDQEPLWHKTDDEIIEWTLGYQSEHQLKTDGRLGPSTLMTWMSEKYGSGIGGFIIGGREIHAGSLRVARMFVPGKENTSKVQPEVACILSIPELLYATRDRMLKNGRIRAHFSIDSSCGPNDESLVIQWADPAFDVPFCPTHETADYPQHRQCVGIELENVLILYQLDADERQWAKRHSIVKSEIGGKSVNQPALYPSQLQALSGILNVLNQELGIPRIYPVQANQYQTGLLNENELANYRGCLAKYHYFMINNEPGAGFAESVCTLFGELRPVEETPVEKAATPAEVSQNLSSKFNEQREDLSKLSTISSTFVTSSDEVPRFNFSRAVADAYQSGKAARAARMMSRYKHS